MTSSLARYERRLVVLRFSTDEHTDLNGRIQLVKNSLYVFILLTAALLLGSKLFNDNSDPRDFQIVPIGFSDPEIDFASLIADDVASQIWHMGERPWNSLLALRDGSHGRIRSSKAPSDGCDSFRLYIFSADHLEITHEYYFVISQELEAILVLPERLLHCPPFADETSVTYSLFRTPLQSTFTDSQVVVIDRTTLNYLTK